MAIKKRILKSSGWAFDVKIKKKFRGENKPEPKCIACNGSGYYDVTGSPKCSSCNGTGKAKESSL